MTTKQAAAACGNAMCVPVVGVVILAVLHTIDLDPALRAFLGPDRWRLMGEGDNGGDGPPDCEDG
eukprot:2995877-Alexandrium_andersonii.AAC.1